MVTRFHPDGKRVAVGEVGHNIRFYDIENKESLTEIWTLHNSTITSISFSDDGKYMTSSGFDGKIFFYDVENLKILKQFEKVHRGGSLGAVFDENNQIYSAGQDGVIMHLNTAQYFNKE